jgi:myo-inositol-1(or 4)-monophosphatase
MMSNDLEAARAIAVEIAREAATLLLARWRKGGRVAKKGAVDLVTDADLAADALLRERLQRAFPDHRLVTEETAGGDGAGGDGAGGDGAGGDGAGAGADDARPCWFVDPLDGTTNFAHGHPFFAVSLGLVVGGAPALGVVDAPALGVAWSGGPGLGATRGGAPCAPSKTEALEDALLATGFPYDRRVDPDNNLAEFAALKLRAQGIRRCGSAALDLCLVADGTYDGYWEQKLAPWDVAGGAAIVLGAGGAVTDYDGARLRLPTTGGHARAYRARLVATGGPLQDALRRAVLAARAR